MSDDAVDTLFLPFEKGIIPVPSDSVLFLGARTHPALKNFKNLHGVQDFYPHHHMVSSFLTDKSVPSNYAAALCLVPKQKEEAQHDLACAVKATRNEGLVVVSAANDANGNRIEKWMKELGLSPQSLSKNKARVCWAMKNTENKTADQWIESGQQRTVTIDNEDWISQPGIFGWNRADAGSKLLLSHIPDILKGAGADFGCGYGYLSRTVLKRAGVQKFILIDADRRAVECAGKNCADPRASFLWTDLSAPVKGVNNLDFIVMNPPFHEGKSTVPALGRAFIATAAASLKPGGVMYMVANAHLDYETVLREYFAHGDKLAETGGFKIFRTTK